MVIADVTAYVATEMVLAGHDRRGPEVMFWLGLILPVCYVPGVTGSVIPTQWPVLWAVLPLTLWLPGFMTGAHWAGLGFVAYAAASLAWSVSPADSVLGLAYVAVWALSFRLGSSVDDLRTLWKGLAIGMAVNVAVAAVQACGYPVVPTRGGEPAGLLINPNLLAASLALVILGLVGERLWRYVPMLLPGLWLAHSRGGYLALGAGLLARYAGARVAAAALVGAACLLVFQDNESNALRLHLLDMVAVSLTWLGYGAGSFATVAWQSGGLSIQPEFALNDYAQLIFEYGIGALPLFAALGLALVQTGSNAWPALVGAAVLALFFPLLYCPLTAFIGCVAAGHAVRHGALVGDFERYCRSLVTAARGETVPVAPRTEGPVTGWRAYNIAFLMGPK